MDGALVKSILNHLRHGDPVLGVHLEEIAEWARLMARWRDDDQERRKIMRANEATSRGWSTQSRGKVAGRRGD